MKKYITITLLYLMCTICQTANAGFLGIGAYILCVTACEGSCAYLSAGVAAVNCLLPCLTSCETALLIGCFASSTKLTVIINDDIVEKPITDIQAGDIVKTIKDGKPMWTRVLQNSRTSGFHEFLRIDLQILNTRETMHLDITPNHVVILRDGEDGLLRLDTARNLIVGDNMVASDGSIVSVIGLQNTYMQDKYTLMTTEGTVDASGVLVSTICGDVIPGGEHLFQPKMEEWYTMHNQL